MIEKKDLMQALTQFKGMLTNSEMSVIFYNATLKAIEEEIAKLPVEENKDPMPAEAKELIAEASQ